MSLAAVHRLARRRLSDAGIDNAGLDARLMVEHFTGTTLTDAVARPDMPVEANAVAQTEAALSRRAAGEPVHRILGFREFHGLNLKLSAETLEPRPDTETLVEAVLPHVRKTAREKGTCRILDLGTGTGAIALALLAAEPRAVATGTDISGDALATAAANAQALGLSGRFTALRSDWFSEIRGRYDAIVSNPPYIESGDIETLQPEVRDFDPRRALDGGPDGLDAYRIIAAGAAMHLHAGGLVAVEIGSTQKEAVTALFEAAQFGRTTALSDLGGNDRALCFQRLA